MKFKVFTLFCLLTSFSWSQKVIPFVDFNNWFRTVSNGELGYIELQQIKSYKAGDNLVAYIDIKGNLRVYDGVKRTDISNMNLDYQISDNLLAWNIGNTLSMWDDGKTRVLNYFGGDYIVKDNLVIYKDTRYNTISAYWNGVIYPIQYSTGDLNFKNSAAIGENIFAFADNGNIFRVFYKGNLYEIGVWNGTIDFQSGTDIVAFNDPTTRTFAVFENGTFVDVEMQWVKKYKAGRGFIVYEDVNNNLMLYKNGVKTQLSSFPGDWEVKDDVILFQNNNFTYVYYKGETIQAANYKIEEYVLKNGTVVFTNLQGGVTAVSEGTLYELTNLQNAEYEIYGNSVLVKLFNKSFIILQNGKTIRV